MGTFGSGWGWDLDTCITFHPDGNVTVHENGSGSRSRGTTQKAGQFVNASSKLIDRMRESRTLQSTDQFRTQRDRLAEDGELRSIYQKTIPKASRLRPHPVDLGATITSHKLCQTPGCRASHGYVINRLGDDYVLHRWNGRQERFNRKGQLIEISDPRTAEPVRVSLHSDNRIRLVSHWRRGSLVDELEFSYNRKSRLAAIKHLDGRITHVRIVKDDLVEFTNVRGRRYTFDYSYNHNLARIDYPDGTFQSMEYYPKTYFVSKVRQRDGSSRSFKYESNPDNRNYHYWTDVIERAASGEVVARGRHEYQIATSLEGFQYTKIQTDEKDGVRTVTKRGPDRLIDSVSVGESELEFEYANGLPSHVRGPRHTYELHTAPESPDKVLWIEQKPVATGEKVQWHYSYDQLRQLTGFRIGNSTPVKLDPSANQTSLTIAGTQLTFRAGKLVSEEHGDLAIAFARSGEGAAYEAELRNSDGKTIPAPELISALTELRPVLAPMFKNLPDPIVDIDWGGWDF